MTKEELFKRNFPDYCRGDECLSPYFDMFEAGIEIATKEMDVKTIKPLQKKIADLELSLNSQRSINSRLIKENNRLIQEIAKVKSDLLFI